MDIVSRLKRFLDTYEIPNSQFADNCGIPRPSLSQLLNGRNKKISDEVISKIHATYPNLSILWLLFGEGNMELIENIKISEPQNRDSDHSNRGLFPEGQELTANEQFENDSERFSPENYLKHNTSQKQGRSRNAEINFRELPIADSKADNSEDTPASISIPRDTLKKITNIVVFYNDNSFQSFQPIQ